MAGNTSQPGSTVTSRVLAILDSFDEQHRSLTLSELAGRSNLPLSTVHRLANELVAHGALGRTSAGGFVIGRQIWSLGMLAPVQTGLREIASPFLSDLHAATLATVHLAVRDGNQALYLDRLSGNRSVPVVSTIGSRLPLYATGVGKVLLAHAGIEVQERELASLKRITAYTITQPKRLRAQLEQVRANDFATTAEEMTLGACSIAVPIRGPGNDVVAALGIVVPSLQRERLRLLTALRVASNGIDRSLDTQGGRHI